MSDLALLTPDLPALPGSMAGQCEHLFAGLPQDVQATIAGVRPFLDSVFAAAPYLGRLAQRRPEGLALCVRDSADERLEAVIAAARAIGAEAADIASLDAGLRQAKADMHLLVALADLAGRWDVAQVTGAVTAGMRAVGFVGGGHLDGMRAAHAQNLQDTGASAVLYSLDGMLEALLDL